MAELRFDGRVCVVTGAGGGLGRAYALLFASRGAKVVVNDLGGSLTGDQDQSSSPAAKVVAEIKANGGEAVANYDSVEFGDKIIQTAMQTYGRVDIVINNAGILRDKSFVKMTDKDWHLVNTVHARGSYSVSKAAWEIMRKQNYGRIIMTSSAAGLFGNVGQANYSAAKLAITGLANTLAMEGKSKNILVNTIAPVAGTRMTATIMPPDLLEKLCPEFVAPVVAFLAHESNETSGKIFEVGGGWIACTRRERTRGKGFPLSRTLLPEDIRNHWDEIVDQSEQDHPTSTQDLGIVLDQINKEHPHFPEPPIDLRFDGKVVVVTGAGGGLGRTYALLFASRGAKVVVNDLGGSIKGDSEGNSRPAQVVVDEIKKLGGEAVPNFDSVEFGDKIIATAMENYGRVDIVINNAGILRDRSFVKMNDQDFDLVYKVHATGSYSVSKAAWEIMRKQNFGRIIMTTSAAGLYGNYGQANYSAAKLAILGLGNTLAREGARRNIHVNTIAPIAGTRMTATVMPENLVAALKTEYVAPLVLFLCHESTQVNGGCFEVGAGWISSVGWQRSKGVLVPTVPSMKIESVRDSWEKINDFSVSSRPSSADDSISAVISAAEEAKSETNDGNEFVTPSKVLGFTFDDVSINYNAKDVALYALSVGAATNPTDDEELSFVYENHQNFQAIPTIGITFAFPVLEKLITDAPGLNFNPMMLLHGEQNLQIHSPIPTSGTIKSSAKISGLYDKGKGVTLVLQAVSTDENGKKICSNEFTVFIRGIGGYGGDRGPAPEKLSPPDRKPDIVHTEKTQENQALIYRLGSGDMNPLHADPSMAAMGGFDKPILHGMCSYGFAGRAILKHFCGNDASKFTGIKARMTKHVFPGETLETQMWKVSDEKIIFQVRSVERDVIVLGNACATISVGSVAGGGAVGAAFQSDFLFEEIQKRVASSGSELVGKVNGVYHFKLTNGPDGAVKSWNVNLKDGNGFVKCEVPTKADCTITLSDEDCMNLFAGKLNPQQAFMTGKLKISGNMAFAMKLSVLVDGEKAKL